MIEIVELSRSNSMNISKMIDKNKYKTYPMALHIYNWLIIFLTSTWLKHHVDY